jgi:hypothetical protein
MNAHFKLFAAFLIDMGALDNSKGIALSRQWNRAGKRSTGTERRVDDLLCSLVNYFVIVCLKTDTDALLRVSFYSGFFGVCHKGSLPFISGFAVTSLCFSKATFSQQTVICN